MQTQFALQFQLLALHVLFLPLIIFLLQVV